MFYYEVSRPSYYLAKTDPKKYQEQWEAYVKSRIYAQQRAAEFESDMIALTSMRNMYAMQRGFLGLGMPCRGCTLGGGFGLFI